MVLSLLIMIFLNNIYVQYEFILLKKQNYKISNSPSKQNKMGSDLK